MDAHEASCSITLIASVLGVTRADYDAWKSRAAHRGQCTSARRRSDEVVAWEHEVTGGTYGAPRIHRALQLGGVDVSVREVIASMRRLHHWAEHAPASGPARWARYCGS